MSQDARVSSAPQSTRPTLPAWSMYIAGAALVLCYAEYLLWMLQRWWRDEYYGHGVFIPLVSGFIIYRASSRLKQLPRERFAWGMPVAALGVLLHIAATYTDVHAASGFAFLITLYGLAIWTWGWPIARAVAFPAFYLVFMVPVARVLVDQFAQPLQLFSAKFGAEFASAIGIPTTREGTIIHIPDYTFEVAIICSGLKSAIAMSALGTLYGYLVRGKLWQRLVIVAASIPVALVANGSRIALTLILGRVFGAEAAEGFFHTASGAFVFIVALIGLFLTGLVLGCSKIREGF